jgi:hypothetical protein
MRIRPRLQTGQRLQSDGLFGRRPYVRAQQREGTRGLGWRSGAVVRCSSNSPVRQIRIAREHANPTSPRTRPKVSLVILVRQFQPYTYNCHFNNCQNDSLVLRYVANS